MTTLDEKIAHIDRLLEMLDQKRPLPKNSLKSLRDKLALEWTYNSNGIEGNTLTLRETKVVLEGITVGGRTIKEHLEARNHGDAISFLEDIVARNEPITQWQIKSIHGLVLKGIDDAEAGRYRSENVVITGASTTPPGFLYLNDEMAGLIDWYGRSASVHPVRRAAELHAKFVEIHPFVDGNGRTGRLLMNFDLMKCGYPPAIILKDDRLRYYDALDEACRSKNYDLITDLVVDACRRSLQTYLSVMEPGAELEP
jgi:Fic family protein